VENLQVYYGIALFVSILVTVIVGRSKIYSWCVVLMIGGSVACIYQLTTSSISQIPLIAAALLLLPILFAFLSRDKIAVAKAIDDGNGKRTLYAISQFTPTLIVIFMCLGVPLILTFLLDQTDFLRSLLYYLHITPTKIHVDINWKGILLSCGIIGFFSLITSLLAGYYAVSRVEDHEVETVEGLRPLTPKWNSVFMIWFRISYSLCGFTTLYMKKRYPKIDTCLMAWFIPGIVFTVPLGILLWIVIAIFWIIYPLAVLGVGLGGLSIFFAHRYPRIIRISKRTYSRKNRYKDYFWVLPDMNSKWELISFTLIIIRAAVITFVLYHTVPPVGKFIWKDISVPFFSWLWSLFYTKTFAWFVLIVVAAVVAFCVIIALIMQLKNKETIPGAVLYSSHTRSCRKVEPAGMPAHKKHPEPAPKLPITPPEPTPFDKMARMQRMFLACLKMFDDIKDPSIVGYPKDLVISGFMYFLLCGEGVYLRWKSKVNEFVKGWLADIMEIPNSASELHKMLHENNLMHEARTRLAELIETSILGELEWAIREVTKEGHASSLKLTTEGETAGSSCLAEFSYNSEFGILKSLSRHAVEVSIESLKLPIIREEAEESGNLEEE